MKLNIKELKETMNKISLAVEKSKINPQSGWIKIYDIDNNRLCFKVTNSTYDLEIKMPKIGDSANIGEITILAETFIPLISKLDADEVEFSRDNNSLLLKTFGSEYTFPLITEENLSTKIDIDDCCLRANNNFIEVDGNDLASVATINSNGLINATFRKDIQQYIYVDNNGAITFTENIYVNNFKNPSSKEYKILLTISQARLLGIFENLTNIKMLIMKEQVYDDGITESNRVCIYNDNVILLLDAQNSNITSRFPSIRLRELSTNPIDTHIVIDKKKLDKALSRLMIFDKVFDIEVLDYSKLVFKENELELVSIKNKNSEKIPYISSQNVFYHESIIRFADLVTQLKAVNDKEIDISYGDKPAIVINGNCKQLIPEIIKRG